jgi:hypothetical protein
MEDTYLPAFQAGVEKGNASSMMCSYNAESAGEGIFGSGERTNHRNLPWLVSVCLGHAP